jgi:hypothetical protein
MTNGRWAHTATLLQDGRVLAAGGYLTPGSDGTYHSAELYDPHQPHWRPTRDMNDLRANHTATLLPVPTCGARSQPVMWMLSCSATSVVLVIGGLQADPSRGAQATVEMYDPVTEQWWMRASMKTPRAFQTATLLKDGTVLVTGGVNSPAGPTGIYFPTLGGPWASAEIYDPATDTWTTTGSMHFGRFAHTATSLPDGRVLVAGGDKNGSAELYDPKTRTWSVAAKPAVNHTFGQAALVHLPACQPVACPYGDAVLAMGGGVSVSKSAELYFPSTNTWMSTGNMPSEYGYGAAATSLPSGRVLITGDGTAVDLFDPTTRHWTVVASMQQYREEHAVTMVGFQVMVTGGGSDTSTAEVLAIS